jgi:signal transduction histidine kinase
LNLNGIRLRLTLGYLGVFTLILLTLSAIGVAGFSKELIVHQDELLTQEARNQARNLTSDERREVLADGSEEFGWIVVDPDGRVIEEDSHAASLGLPHAATAREALREGSAVPTTIEGPVGRVRVVSTPMHDSDETVGVIQYARSLEALEETIYDYLIVLLPLGLGGLGLAALGGAYMAGRAVRPVRVAFERQRTFIADASHELKTPLTLIRANTEVLQRGLDDRDDRELARDVLVEADRMSEALSELLLVARLDAGKLTIEEKMFDLTAVVWSAVGRFEARADSGGIRVEVLAPEELAARGDPARTEQILTALLDNALRHTPEGGKITVTARRSDGRVETVVEDSGPGIAPEHLPRVFERFYRADAARQRDGGGTGLGLAIARDLARAQRGGLQAGNSETGGAAFVLELPAS